MHPDIVISIFIGLSFLFACVTRPQLKALVEPENIKEENLAKLKENLYQSERNVVNLIEGTEANIQFVNPDDPKATDLVFMYVHGFSATWKETDPVASILAQRFNANLIQCRIAGHGTGPQGMRATAEDWIESLNRQAEIASKIGRNIIVIGVSTGAPLAIWLATKSIIKAQISSLLFMSPNFKIRPGIGFLLTWPITSQLIRVFFAGRYRSWVPANQEQAKYWTTKQPISALIEMQKTVDWANKQKLEAINIPIATMYMERDPTINSKAAISTHNRFPHKYNKLIHVEPDGAAPDHVFCGEICGPQRTEWTINTFELFLKTLPEELLLRDSKQTR